MEDVDIPAYAKKLGYVPFEGDRLVIGSDMIVICREKHTFTVIDLLDKTDAEVEREVSGTYGMKMNRSYVLKSNLLKQSSKDPGTIKWNGIYSVLKEQKRYLMKELELRDLDSEISQKNADLNYGAIEAFLYEGTLFVKEKHIRS